MPNTSATGGYLTQLSGPIEGTALTHFLHALLVGMTGYAPDLVRPAYQNVPPPTPNFDVNWLAYWLAEREPDDNPGVRFTGVDSRLTRYETWAVRCMFYGPNAHDAAARLRDGFGVSQNHEALFLQGLGYVRCSTITRVPELINARYLDRADITITLVAELTRVYAILALLVAQGAIDAESITEPYNTEDIA